MGYAMPIGKQHGKRSRRASDTFLFANVLKVNGVLKAGTPYYVEGGYGIVRANLKRYCGRLGSKMVGKDKGWMVTPIADVWPRIPPVPIVVPPDLTTRESIDAVADYLRTRPAGSQCGMTKGPPTNQHLNGEFLQRGVRISFKGAYGNRIITFVRLDNSRVEGLKGYKGSKRTTNKFLIGEVKKAGGIPANTPTYVQGNHTTLVRQLLKYVGPNNYSANKTVDVKRGPGWIVTVKVPILP